MKVKFIIILAVSIIYTILCILRMTKFSGDPFFGIIYSFYAVVVLLYCCKKVFSLVLETEDLGGAALTGALALGAFTVSEVYSFVYFFIYRGETSDITVGYYSGVCAFVLLSLTAILLISPEKAQKRRFTIGLNLIFGAIIAFIMFALVINDWRLLYRSTLVLLLLCLLPTAYILWLSVKEKSAEKFKPLRLLAVVIILLCMFRSYSHAMRINDSERFFRYLLFSLHPPLYLLLGLSVRRLFVKEAKSDE